MLSLLKRLLFKIKHKPLRWLIISSCSIVFLMVGFVMAIFVYAYSLGPPALTNEQNTVYYSDSGDVIGEERGPESRYWVDLNDMDSQLIEATLITEDRRFYEHSGFDLKRIIGAAIQDIRSMSMVQGASTITQQYARNLYLSHEKTWKRKLKEALYTIRLEMFYEKDELLEGYLNTIYYGHGAYGVEAASRYFFNTSADNLSIAEATLLAGIPKGPTYYSPFHHYQNAKDRQVQILNSLHKENLISKKEFYLASHEKMNLTEPENRSKKVIAPYFQDVVLQELQQLLNEDIEEIRSGGYQVYTTLNTENQQQLETSTNKTLDINTEMQVAGLAMDPKNGAIISLIGGRDHEKSQYNRAFQAKRMPGSSFKPFLYYAALENGYTATTSLMSKPTNFELADGTVYQPSNYNGYYADKPITLAQAIALSDNVYAVKTNLFIQPEKLVDTARDFGITSKLRPVASLALGTESVSVQEMVAGYSMIANGGQSVTPHTIKKVTDSEGNVMYERPEKKSEPTLDPRNTFILTHLMTGMFDESLNGYMQVTGATIADQLSQNYAGKSGTTKTDSWMIGYSPSIVTGIWTGYDKNKPIEKINEQQYSKQIWASFMEKAHEDKPLQSFKVPEGIVGAYVDPISGDLATPYCKEQRLMYFVEGTEPNSYCSVHRPDDSEGEKEPQPEDRKKNIWDWLPFIGD
ncbi:transglycosylase domain-containing protein [Aquibacillus rhizosphaerae]|uniref:PBP1A family penicillin-binding protein n=1 Tax=Aquibacillus rhizosphaerae TaxID=3051431 RepID=A0ABT7KZW5_9BACI|nr:PBP1A family penicillin-binding protein [Aquibacillus sp. LR5S19]MDL4839097.1 PBP1A family penicillin-binding protein [Aquibacillus sp. LR5S19]